MSAASRMFDSRWLAYVMNSPVIRAQIAEVQYGAAQEQIDITDAVNFVIPTPPLVEQQRIAAWLDDDIGRIDLVTDKIRQSTAALREYRQALITAAVTGQIDVRGDPGYDVGTESRP